MTTSSFRLAGAFLLLSLGACTTVPVVPFRVHELKETGWDGTAILFSYEMEFAPGVSKPESCIFEWKNHDTGRVHSFALNGEKGTLLAEAPPGTYTGRALSCPGMKKWSMGDFPKRPVTLVANRINYVGKVRFQVEKLKSVDELTRVYPGRESVTRDLKRALLGLNPKWRDEVVAASTGRPVRGEMLSSLSGYVLKIEAKVKGQEKEPLEGLKKDLLECQVSEEASHWPLLGYLDYAAVYENGALEQLDVKAERDAFSPEFTECLKSVLRSFKPALPRTLEIRVKL